MLAWEKLDPRRLERAVQLLIQAMHPGATAMDGAGGDGGQDVRWDSPFGLVIFEIKSFSDRLTSGRRGQIRDSLARALTHEPARWVLVAPLNPTPGELAWFDRLRNEAAPTHLEWRGRDWLDLALAGREDIRSYLEGADYELLRRAGEFHFETAALSTGSDYASRLDSLNSLVDTLTPYWSWRPTVFDGTQALMLVAKRPDSADLDPIELKPVFEFPSSDPGAQEMADQVRRALDTGGDFDVPGEYVRSFQVTAASEATQRLIGNPDRNVARILFRSVPEQISLHGRLRANMGETKRTIELRFTQRVTGGKGGTLHGSDLSGALSVELRVTRDRRAELTLGLAELVGLPASHVLPALLLLATSTDDVSIQLEVGTEDVGTFGSPNLPGRDLQPLARYVLALSIIAAHTDNVITIPDDDAVTSKDIIEIIRVGRALSGHQVRLPVKQFTATLVPEFVKRFLESVPIEGGALFIRNAMVVKIGDRELPISGLATWLPKIRLVNREELTGQATQQPQAIFETFDDEGMYLIRDPEHLGQEWKPLGEILESPEIQLLASAEERQA